MSSTHLHLPCPYLGVHLTQIWSNLVSVLSSSLLIGFCLPYVVKTMLIFCEPFWLTVSLSSKSAESDKFYLKPLGISFYKY